MDIQTLIEDINTYLKESLKNRIQTIIKDEKLPYYIAYDEGDRVGVEVSGDWKHDHAYFNNLMRSNGFTLDNETTCDDEDNGGDYYTSIHYFTENFNESLNGYEIDGKIVHNDKGYNVADNKDNLMLNKNIPTLKQLLLELAKYM